MLNVIYHPTLEQDNKCFYTYYLRNSNELIELNTVHRNKFKLLQHLLEAKETVHRATGKRLKLDESIMSEGSGSQKPPT